MAKITEVLRTSVSIHCYNLLFSIFLFQSHNCHSDSSLCLIQSPWNQQRSLRWLLWALHGHLLKSLHPPQCSWWSSISCSQTAVANWARHWWNPLVNHQKTAPVARHSKQQVMLKQSWAPLGRPGYQELYDLELHKVSQYFSPSPLPPLQGSEITSWPQGHCLKIEMCSCIPQSCWAAVPLQLSGPGWKKSSPSLSAGLHLAGWTKSQGGLQRGRAFAFSLLSTRNKEATRETERGGRKERGWAKLSSSFEGTVVINGLMRISF